MAQKKRRPVEQSRAERGRTPVQLSRQEEVFKLRVIERLTVRQVAEVMGISQDTVIADERAELQRRTDELADRREVEKAAQLAMVDDLYLTSVDMRGVPGSGALGAAGKALEMRAKLLGLDAPTKIDLGLDKLITAFDDEG